MVEGFYIFPCLSHAERKFKTRRQHSLLIHGIQKDGCFAWKRILQSQLSGGRSRRVKGQEASLGYMTTVLNE